MTATPTPAALGQSTTITSTHTDAADKRALFERIVDDIRRQVSEGILRPGDQLDSARQLAEHHGVAGMTAQRALRELQSQRITFSVRGIGTFIHPDALAALHGTGDGPSPPKPGPGAQILGYLAQERVLFARYVASVTTADRDATLSALLAHAGRNRALIDATLDGTGTRTRTAGRHRRPPWWRRK